MHHIEIASRIKNELGSALSLTLPESILNMSALVYQKKFRYARNKSGGLRGWEMLQSAGLGELRGK